MGLKRLSTTAQAMATIENGYSDPYEPGTRRERAYMCGIASVYKEDCIDDAATITATAMEEIIEIATQDVERDLDDLEV